MLCVIALVPLPDGAVRSRKLCDESSRAHATASGVMPNITPQIHSLVPTPVHAWLVEAERLDVAVYAAIAATPTPTLDASLRRLSRAAGHSKLWLGCAALLAAVGGERGRAAALDGLASVALRRPSSTSCSSAWPAAGVPLSVVASLVAYSRVHTGVHYPSDAIAGMVSGVALAPVAVTTVRRRPN